MTTDQLELEQQIFEDWYRANYTTHIPMWNGEYQNGVVQIAWESWKAALSQKVSDIQPQARKAFICKNCEGVYADAPVSQCDCMPDKQEWFIAYLSVPQETQQITDASIADKIDKFNSRQSDSEHVDKPTDNND